MGSKGTMSSAKRALALALILFVFPLELGSQSPVAGLGCSFQGLHLDKCLNQDGGYLFLEPCCRAVNLALRDGFHCLCSVIAANAPQFATLFSWSLTSCYIAVPPLTMCQDLATMPISLPVALDSPPKEMNTWPSVQENITISPPPPLAQPANVALASSSKANSTVAETEQVSNNKVTSSLHVVENKKKVSSDIDSRSKNVSSASDSTEVLCYQTWFLSLAVYSLVLVA